MLSQITKYPNLFLLSFVAKDQFSYISYIFYLSCISCSLWLKTHPPLLLPLLSFVACNPSPRSTLSQNPKALLELRRIAGDSGCGAQRDRQRELGKAVGAYQSVFFILESRRVGRDPGVAAYHLGKALKSQSIPPQDPITVQKAPRWQTLCTIIRLLHNYYIIHVYKK